jgi:UDP-N-acetylglucosamine:LPS N-acetylglucosamine transferase
MPDSHQEANAAVFARYGAGVVLDQRALDGQRLAAEVRALLADPTRRATLGAAAGELLAVDAADRICEEIEAVALVGAPFMAPWAR